MKDKKDDCYKLINNHREQENIQKRCAFSGQIIEKYDESIGPFKKEGDDALLYFHHLNLERNNFVKYDKTDDVWINIQTALKNLVQQKTYKCYRCH